MAKYNGYSNPFEFPDTLCKQAVAHDGLPPQRRSQSHFNTAPVSALVAKAVYLPRQPVV
jgi:hypothetical protein